MLNYHQNYISREIIKNIVVGVLRRLRLYSTAITITARLTALKLMFQAKNERVKFNLRSIEKGHFNVTYRGIRAVCCPFDYVIYQMLISELRPDLVIEIGTAAGGGALYLADLMNIVGHGIVHTIDIERKSPAYGQPNEIVRQHPRITLFTEGWQHYDVTEAQKFTRILVIDDGSHIYEDTLSAMRKFAPLISVGSYLIVEDGVLTEVGKSKYYNGGPLRAIREFLKSNSDFMVDRHLCDLFGKNATFNINGYLKRVGNQSLPIWKGHRVRRNILCTSGQHS